jgi:hypothetical protein
LPDSLATLRRFPYPYRAALALCNDADFMTEESFRFFHRFLNGRMDTPLGQGLGLEVGDSFFLFRSEDSPNTFSYFANLSERPSALAPLIREYARCGLLDTLHTYGDFSSPDDFRRDLARTGIEMLKREGISIKVWVNHGTASNTQNLGPPQVSHYRGDDPGHRAYHSDITLDYGMRYFWFGHQLSDWIGHDPRWGVRAATDWARARLARPGQADRYRTRLLTPARLRDGRSILSFQRFAGTSGTTPTIEDLPRQLSLANLRRLEARAGYAVVYQHLGVRRQGPGFGTAAYQMNKPPFLEDEERAALERLAQEYWSGRLWVTTTSRLLEYNELWHGLVWRERRDGAHSEIIIDGVQSPGAGRRALEREEVSGLTFDTKGADDLRIFLEQAGGPVSIPDVIFNPPDHRGHPSVTVAPRPRHWPDL